MKPTTKATKDRTVRAMAGFIIISLLVLQKVLSLDLSVLIMATAINLFQFGITGWCPVANYFTKIGWLQNN